MAGSVVVAIVLAVLAALVADGPAPVIVAVGGFVVALVLAIIGEHRIEATRVGIDLDASRRWLTISRVHPAFATACAEHRAASVDRR